MVDVFIQTCEPWILTSKEAITTFFPKEREKWIITSPIILENVAPLFEGLSHTVTG